MNRPLNIEIAGITLSLTGPDELTLHEPPPLYKPFIRESSDNGEVINIDLRLEPWDLPDARGLSCIFETGDSWSMYRDEDHYYVAMHSAAPDKKNVWVSRLDLRSGKVTIFCSDLLVTEKNGRRTLSNPLFYPLDQLLIMYALAPKSGAIIHAAGVEMDGMGYIFPGRSGAGKSTLSRWFTGREEFKLLSDDRVAVRRTDDRFLVFGTPWAGEAGIAENINLPLGGIFFIHHDLENRLEKLLPREAYRQLMPVTAIPWYDTMVMPGIIDLCESLVHDVPAGELHFRPDRGVADFFRDHVSL